MEDSVNSPKHYTSHPSGIECIQVVEHMPFNLGNVVKYCWRFGEKGGVEDLRKAQWYLQREIDRLEKGIITKAGPLIAAEIDRLHRLAKQGKA